MTVLVLFLKIEIVNVEGNIAVREAATAIIAMMKVPICLRITLDRIIKMNVTPEGMKFSNTILAWSLD